MVILIMIVLVLLYIGFPWIGEPLLFVVVAAVCLYVELFWLLLRLPWVLFAWIVRATFAAATRGGNIEQTS